MMKIGRTERERETGTRERQKDRQTGRDGKLKRDVAKRE